MNADGGAKRQISNQGLARIIYDFAKKQGEAIEALAQATAKGFQEMNDKIDKIERRLDHIEIRLDKIEYRLDRLEENFVILDAKFTTLEITNNRRLTLLEDKMMVVYPA